MPDEEAGMAAITASELPEGVHRASEEHRGRRDGWRQAAQRGSHCHYRHPTKPGRVTVAGETNQDVAPGALGLVLADAGYWSEENATAGTTSSPCSFPFGTPGGSAFCGRLGGAPGADGDT